MLAALSALLLLATPADTLPGAIRGSVQSEPSGVPLALAVVQVEADGRVLDTVTDSTGAYRLRRVPAGRRLLRVRHLDHAPLELEVLVPAGGEVALDFALRPAPLALPAVEVQGVARGGAADTAVASHGEMALVSSRALEAGAAVAGAGLGHGGRPGGPGGGEGNDPGDVLYVRGSSADLKLVLLDGAPVYAPFHMGGLIPTFEPEALGSARLYLGGAPARYDGGLSYVLDMRTRAGRPEHARVAGAADLLSARLLAEGPLPAGATFLVAGRGVHGGAVGRLEGSDFPYGYGEGLARLDLPLPGGSELGFTAFANREEVRVDSLDARDPLARWGNAAGSLRWRGEVGGAHAEATAALTGFRARLPWRSATRAMVMQAGIGRARGALDLSRPAWGGQLRYGLSYDRMWVEHRAGLRAVEGEPIRLASDSRGDAGGAYVDAAWQPLPRLAVRAGLRGDAFSVGRTLSLSPRLSATWLFGEGAALTLAGGRYHQYVRQAGTAGTGTVPGALANFGDSLGVGTRVAVSRATHAAVALDQQLGPELRLGLEGYFKHFEGLPPGDRARSYHSGVDVWARRTDGPVSGWLGYSLGWSWSEDEDGAWGTQRFSGRHLVSAGVAGEMGRFGRVGARLAYGAGLPYTAVYGPLDGDLPPTTGITGNSGNGGSLDSSAGEGGAPLSGGPRDPYLRVDVEVSRTWTPRWGGRRAELTPYLRVLNALDRRDALFYRNDGTADGASSVATLPLLPIAGVSFRF